MPCYVIRSLKLCLKCTHATEQKIRNFPQHYSLAAFTPNIIFTLFGYILLLCSQSTQDREESARETSKIICECINNLLTDIPSGEKFIFSINFQGMFCVNLCTVKPV